MIAGPKYDACSKAISVVMSVHNVEQFLAEAIESIIAQTFEDFEFLIIDDGSTDHTHDILAHYARRDRRISVVNQEHLGLANALNVGCYRAKGRYIARMDGDDI